MWPLPLLFLVFACSALAAPRSKASACAGQARLTWALDLDRQAVRRVSLRRDSASDCARPGGVGGGEPRPNAVIEVRDESDAMIFRKALYVPVIPHGKPVVSVVMPWDGLMERRALRLRIVRMKDGKTLGAGQP